MRNQVFKKLFSVLLALIMVAGLLPASVLAEGWTAADVATTPAPTETEQPAEPTPEQGEPTAEPAPTQGEPTAEPVPTQGEPTAEPTDEGIMPANVMPVQASVAARDTSGDDYYRIVHLDCGREYFTKDWIIALINEMAEAGYNQLQLAFGNGGFRFYLDNMAVGSYTHEQVMEALEAGNNHYNTYGDGEDGPTNSEWIEYNPSVNALTQTEMTAIIKHARSKGIEIVPMLNTPGHMHAVLAAMSKLGISGDLQVSGKPGCLNLGHNEAVPFTQALVIKYVDYFKDEGCKFFNFAMDEYSSFDTSFFAYANYLIAYASAKEITPRVFNDALSNGNTKNGFIEGTQVCCWDSTQNTSNYSVINTSHDFYYVSTNEQWNLYREGYTFVGDYAEEAWINHASKFNNNTFLYKKVSSNINPVGSMFCIWCNTPGKNTETLIAQQIRMILRVIGARMQNSNEYKPTDELVEGGFKADGTINVPTNNKTVGNDNDTVRVTGPNLAALKCETATVAIQGAAEGKIAAYNVTPSTADNNKYTGEAEVRIKIPEGWDSSKVIAFIVENDGTAKDIVDGTATEDGWYVFTAPHFSVMGIYEKAATTEVSRTITIVEGKEEVLTVDGKVDVNKIGNPADTAIAIKTGVNYGTKPGEGTQFTLGNKITTGDGVISDGNGNYLVVSEKGEISNTKEIADATVFNVTSSGYLTTYYTIQVKGRNQYLTINNNNKLAIQNSSSSWYYYNGYGFYQQKSWDYYYLKFNNGWTASTGNGTSGYLYERKGNAILDDITKITFKGIKTGTTTVTVAGVEYTIEVKAAELENVVLPINLWITNTGVVPTGWGTSYNSVTREGFTYGLDATTGSGTWNTFRAIYELKATEGNINSEQGAKLSELIPNTGKAYGYRGGNTPEGYDVDIWKCSYNTSEERQSTDGWTNSSNKGTEFEHIRYWDNKWEYYSATTGKWIEISEVGAGKDDSVKNQVCVWYRQVTTITDEVTTEIVDWGPIKYGEDQCLLDFAVKYSGIKNNARVPDSFPVANKTIGFDCPTIQQTNGYVVADSEGNYYRVVYGIAGVETKDYEVYMITVKPTSDTHTETISDRTSYKYEGTEKIAWAKTETDANTSELGKTSDIEYGGEPFLDSVKIYKNQGLLVTYYLRAKKTETSLTVHYAIKGSSEAFHEYNIIVKANEYGTYPTFDENIGLNQTNKKGPLDNGTIVNSTGVTITVSSDLSTLENLEPQYRYSDYEVVESWRQDGKNVWIYYTFKREHTYVIDFGLPLNIQFSDFGVTDTSDIKAVSFVENEIVTKKTGTHGTAEVIEPVSGEKYVRYTLDKPLGQNITIPLYVKFNQRGDNDKPQLFTANIIPATNVYYEDSFAKFYDKSGNEQTSCSPSTANDEVGIWYIDGQEKTANQALEALGTKENVYGYDPAYNNCTKFSMGSARKVTVTSDMATTGVVWPTAQFTFKGTGFDIISLTDNTSGAIFVDVYKGNSNSGEREKGHVVNNYYGYTYSEEKGWEINNNPNAIYQVPVIKVSGLTYGEHTVVIKVCYDKIFDVADGKKYSFWLDAVRVYDPAGSDLDKDYVKDREVKPIYVEVRKALIEKNSFTADTTVLANGAVFIDGKSTGASIDDYKNFGPNHEVYLASSQAIAFRIVADKRPATVQIGVKLANGSTGTLKISGGSDSTPKFAKYNGSNSEVAESDTLTLSTATDMYYALNDITWTEKKGSQESNVIVLTNTGENSIVSITNVKCTYANAEESTTNTVALAISYDDALMAVDAVNNAITPVEPEPEPEPEPEKTFEPERFEASWSRNVMQGRKATLTVKTSEDVEAITVDGQTIRSYRTRTERVGFGRRAKRITYREFTYSMVAQESADFSVTAINAEGTESEAITARLTVKTRPNSMRDMWDWFKGWF